MGYARIRYQRLPHQKLFDESQKFYDLLLGGYGSGKTYSLCMKTLKLCAINHGMAGGIVAPTYKMFKRDVLPTMKDICGANGVPIKWIAHDSIMRFPLTGNEIYVFHGEDDGVSIRGPNLAFMMINEATLLSQAAFHAALARVRIKDAKLLQVCLSGTPEGFNWLYDMFIAEPREDADVFYGDTRTNTFISEHYAQNLINSYDDILVQQFVEGRFVNTTRGTALYKFNRMKHVKDEVKYNPEREVWVTLDFNVNPFAATLWNYYPEQHVKLRAFDEVCLEGADTYTMADTIWDKIGERTGGVVVFPDFAGNQKRTSAEDNITDIEILEQKGFTDIRYTTKHSVRASLNAANAFVGKNQIELDRKQCKKTIIDFEQCTLKPGTNNLDKSNLKRTHWLDGFKNMCEYEFPITAGAGGWKTTQVR